jgi:hypothetical protein
MDTKLTDTLELRSLAEQMYNYLERRERDDKTKFVTWKDDTPPELERWFMNVEVGDSFGDLDEKYEIANELCALILDTTVGEEPVSEDDIRDTIQEHEWLDIYNYDRLQWVMDDLSRGDLVDEALQDMGGGLYEAIGYAQNGARQETAYMLLDAMIERASEQ